VPDTGNPALVGYGLFVFAAEYAVSAPRHRPQPPFLKSRKCRMADNSNTLGLILQAALPCGSGDSASKNDGDGTKCRSARLCDVDARLLVDWQKPDRRLRITF
jgi:hypothetical protein